MADARASAIEQVRQASERVGELCISLLKIEDAQRMLEAVNRLCDADRALLAASAPTPAEAPRTQTIEQQSDYLRGYATALIDAIASLSYARDKGGSDDAGFDGLNAGIFVIRQMRPPSAPAIPERTAVPTARRNCQHCGQPMEDLHACRAWDTPEPVERTAEAAPQDCDVLFGKWKDEAALHQHALGEWRHWQTRAETAEAELETLRAASSSETKESK